MAVIPADEKVFMVSNGTNTTYGGSAALKAMQQWYTMEDVTNTVRPYRVFTALLTQSGGDDIQSITSGALTIGVTYRITDDTSNPDFTNVGAPNNNLDTYFVATGTTPNSWGQAQLQYNTGAPVATVLENTIGNIWFTYNIVGVYFVISNNLFINNKSMAIIGTPMESVNNSNFAGIVPNGETQFLIEVVEPAGVSVDDVLAITPIEIRVYN